MTLGLAKHCSACLPNIEDEFFPVKRKKGSDNKVVFFSEIIQLKIK